MRKSALTGALLATTFIASPVLANDDVTKQIANPNQWVLQTGDYFNQRYSKLDQIQRQRQEPEGRVDLLDWRASWP